MKKIISISSFIFLLALSPLAMKAQTVADALKAIDYENVGAGKAILSKLGNEGNSEAYFNLANYFQSKGNTDSAKHFFNKAYEVNPTSAAGLVSLGKLSLDNNDLKGATSLFAKAVKAGKKSPGVDLMIAQAYANSANPNIEKAMEILKKITSKDKSNSKAMLLMGDLFLRNQDGGGNALTAFENAAAADPTNPIPSMRIGEIYDRANNYEESMKGYESAIAADVEFAPAYRKLADLHQRAQKNDDAASTYNTYLSKTGVDVDKQNKYAKLIFNTKNYPQAIEEINKAKALGSKDPVMDRLLGYSKYETESYAESVKAMENFFTKRAGADEKILPSDYEYLGRAQSKLGQDSLAAISLQSALDLDTSLINLRDDISLSLYKNRKYASAAEQYELKGLKQELSAKDYFYMARSFYNDAVLSKQDSAGSIVKADTSISKLIAMQPDFLSAYLWKAKIAFIQDRNMQTAVAAGHYEKFIELASTDAEKYKRDLIEAYSYLGYYNLQTDNNDKCRAFYNKVLELDPENKNANLVITSLNKKK